MSGALNWVCKCYPRDGVWIGAQISTAPTDILARKLAGLPAKALTANPATIMTANPGAPGTGGMPSWSVAPPARHTARTKRS